MTDTVTNDAPQSEVKLDTPHARAMIERRYPAPEWATLYEVAPSTGGGTRYADAVAVNLWSSRGHAIHGFEIKVHRSDWLRELKKPEKAETSVYKYCNHWWIVAPRGVVKDGELPPNWGLLELRANGLFQTIAAPRLDPVPITIGFFASLVRRMHESIDAAIDTKMRVAMIEREREYRDRLQRDIERSTERHRSLQERVKQFEQETGLSFENYPVPPAQMVRLAQHLAEIKCYRTDGVLGRLLSLAQDLERAAADVRRAVDASGVRAETEVKS